MSAKKRKAGKPLNLKPRGPRAGTANVLKGNTLWRTNGSVLPKAAAERSLRLPADPPGIVSQRSMEKQARELKKIFKIHFFEERKGATNAQAEKAWNEVSKAHFALQPLLETQKRQTIEFKKIEECVRTIYLNQPIIPTKENLQKVVERYRVDWNRDQTNLKLRIKIAKFNPDEDFRKRIMDPKTREAAIRRYLIDDTQKRHFLIQALKILFELTDRR